VRVRARVAHQYHLKTHDKREIKKIIIYISCILYELQFKSYLNFKLFTCNSSCDCTVSIPKSWSSWRSKFITLVKIKYSELLLHLWSTKYTIYNPNNYHVHVSNKSIFCLIIPGSNMHVFKHTRFDRGENHCRSWLRSTLCHIRS